MHPFAVVARTKCMSTTRNSRTCPILSLVAALILSSVSLQAHPSHDHGANNRSEAALEINNEKLLALRAQAARNAATSADFHALGWSLIDEARRTQDGRYFERAAETARTMQDRFGATAQSQVLLGHALHNMHQFAEAEAIAEWLVTERGDPVDYALLSDVLLERGRFPEAVAACQKLADMKPGLEASSRVAHLRWLHGDIEGAIAAMEQAILTGTGSNPEPQAWSLARLSHFYLQDQRFVEARAAARKAASLVEDYPPAFLALGKAELAAGNVAQAEYFLARAAHLNPIPEYQWWHADALEAAGRAREANELREELRQTGASNDPRTFAVFLATTGEQATEALLLARNEVEQRPDPFSWDALAWAQLAAGNPRAAEQSMERALSFNTRDARLFLHAAIIAQHLNNDEAAARFFDQALPLAATLTPLEKSLLERRDDSTRSAVSPRETVSTKQPNQKETNHQS